MHARLITYEPGQLLTSCYYVLQCTRADRGVTLCYVPEPPRSRSNVIKKKSAVNTTDGWLKLNFARCVVCQTRSLARLKKNKNVSREYDRLNGLNSTLKVRVDFHKLRD